MFQNAANKKEGQVAQAGITVPGKEWFIVFPKRDVSVHSRAIVGEERLGHESHSLVMPLGDVSNNVFVVLEVIGHALERGEADVYFGLAGSGDLMVLALNC